MFVIVDLNKREEVFPGQRLREGFEVRRDLLARPTPVGVNCIPKMLAC